MLPPHHCIELQHADLVPNWDVPMACRLQALTQPLNDVQVLSMVMKFRDFGFEHWIMVTSAHEHCIETQV